MDLDAGQAQWFRDFWDISTDRKVEFGMMKQPYIGPIPWSSIRERSKDYGSEADNFAFCMKVMDARYLEIKRENPDAPRIDRSQTFGPQMMRGMGR